MDFLLYNMNDELAIQLDFEKQILQLALLVLEKYEMIEIFEEIIYIKNWEKYQNEEGMGKIREQGRIRVARCREKKKVLAIDSRISDLKFQIKKLEDEVSEIKIVKILP